METEIIHRNMAYGPTIPLAKWVHAEKYRATNETFEEAMERIARTLSDTPEHFERFLNILLTQKFLPAGRIQAAVGATRVTTPFNCFVSMEIKDDMNSIMQAATEAATTMRLGGGIGYDFSQLRPRGELIRSLESKASGPVSFMQIFDAVCKTISSAGHRRGAQMGVLRVDHPDIEEFVRAKHNTDQLTQFNVSVGVTDEFMYAVSEDADFDLRFNGKSHRSVKARALWDEILRSTWDWAEPGVLFLDTMNRKNNLAYLETISATNPCGEQPLPPHGACLLGSWNLTAYLSPDGKTFDWDSYIADIPVVVRAMDNVIDTAIYPLPEQEAEAKNKRRMGLGITGLANCVETLGFVYGSEKAKAWTEKIMSTLANFAYLTSISLAQEKGSFPLFEAEYYGRQKGSFLSTMPTYIQEKVRVNGIRNSHLLSIAPTGTISLSADNISSGIEPVFALQSSRKVRGLGEVILEDWAYARHGVKGKTADELDVLEHIDVLTLVSRYVDSSCSKTCNVGDDVSWEKFKEIYHRAYSGGASGCTTFRASGKRFGIMSVVETSPPATEIESPKDFVSEGGACYFDPTTGVKSCDQ